MGILANVLFSRPGRPLSLCVIRRLSKRAETPRRLRPLDEGSVTIACQLIFPSFFRAPNFAQNRPKISLGDFARIGYSGAVMDGLVVAAGWLYSSHQGGRGDETAISHRRWQ